MDISGQAHLDEQHTVHGEQICDSFVSGGRSEEELAHPLPYIIFSSAEKREKRIEGGKGGRDGGGGVRR